MSPTHGQEMSRRQALRITAVVGVSFALGGSGAAALLRRAGLHRVSVTDTRMGTSVTVTLVHPDAAAARGMIRSTFAEMERLEALLSRHRSDTPVSRLGRDGLVREAPPELLEILQRSLDVATMTDGAFDVTVAPVLDLYRERFHELGTAPSRVEVEDALALVGYRGVRIENRLVTLERPGMAITLDGIAKGYVVDRAVATLVSAGAERVMVEAGGDLATRGRGPDDESWRVAIQDPHHSTGSLGVLRLHGQGVASSGDYVQAFTQDRRLHHLLDPRTGRSPDHTSGVTVTAPTAMDADALSTAAFVVGPAKGLDLLEGLEGVEGLIVTKDGDALRTRGFPRNA
jgi:thiamine biosynthesis lipoprotein